MYRDAARLWVLVAGQALQRGREHPTVERLAVLCRPGNLSALLKAQRHHEDLPRLTQTEMDGVMSLSTSLSILARGVAGPSLGTGQGALRLEEAMSRGKIVLLQLAAGPYPEETRVLGAWALRAMLRLLRYPSPCVLMCDEFARLGVQGRAAIELLALGREFGKAVILATQGPSDLGELGPHALDQAAQDAGWILAFRQGTRDSTTASRLLGVRWMEERSWSKGERDTREHVRLVEQPHAFASALEALTPAIAVLRAPGVDGQGPWVETVRVGKPSLVRRGRPGSATQWRGVHDPGLPASTTSQPTVKGARVEPPSIPSAAETVEVDSDEDPEVQEEVRDTDLERVLRRLEREGEQDGDCRLWPESGCNDQGYPKVSMGTHGEKRRMVTVYKWLWEREHGAVPKSWTLDHLCHNRAKARGECKGGKTCKHPRCCELAHLEAKPHGDNVEQRDEPTDELADDISAGAGLFAIALFERYDRPAVEARTVNLEGLMTMLTTFAELTNKRKARCWSPTLYADGAASRANAGVASVSALVFDLDRVPPDTERLQHVCWIGHTTYSHTAQAPRWRVVIPLARPVPAAPWAEVWRRAHAALCPEADPKCKDASRQHYLPSHPSGVTPEATCHDGPLLEAATLPPLLPEPRRPELRLLPTGASLRKTAYHDYRRAEAYMDGVIRNLAKATQPGRNAALNGAAWTLGHWVAAGVLRQTEVEDALFAAAEANGLVADDGARQCWATIRSGLSKGLLRPVDLDADGRLLSPSPRRGRQHDPS